MSSSIVERGQYATSYFLNSVFSGIFSTILSVGSAARITRVVRLPCAI